MKKFSDQVTVHEAKTHLSRLLAKVSRGRTIIIKRGAQPIAQLVPIRSVSEERNFGADEGKVIIADDFDEMPKKMARFFK